MIAATAPETLILSGAWIAQHVPVSAYVEAVRAAFRRLALGEGSVPTVGHLAVRDGGVHIKSAMLGALAAIKVNANFPANPAQHGLPTIQGFVALMDMQCGRVLALMDSSEVTAQRTAAASAVAAGYLASPKAQVLALLGCGAQARYHFHALAASFALRAVRCYDLNARHSSQMAALVEQHGCKAIVCASATEAANEAEIVVTSTPSRQPLLCAADVRPGTFVAAVGTDSPDKHEIHPDLMARARVVTDLTSQAAAFGDLHHALAAGVMEKSDVYGELATLVSGALPGRRTAQEVFVFDSTGVAIEDLAAAQVIYAQAQHDPQVMKICLAGRAT